MGAVPWLFNTRIGAGIAGATIATAQAVIADSTGAEGRGKGMALIGAAFGIGFTFGPLIGAATTSDAPNLALSDTQVATVAAWSDSDDTVVETTIATELGQLSQRDSASLHRYFKTPHSRAETKAALLQGPSQYPGYFAASMSFFAFLFAFARLPESRSSTNAPRSDTP